MAASRISVRKDHLSCPLCQEVLSNPAAIPCGHSFCMICIQDFWDNEEKGGRFCSCPECQDSFQPRPILIKNIVLAEMVEGMKKSKCGNNVGAGGKRRPVEDGQEAGPSPSHALGWARPSKIPKTTRVSEVPKSRVCPIHGRLLEIYCCDDDQCICPLCALVEHKAHNNLLAKEGRKRKQEQLQDIKKESKQRIKMREQEQKDLRENIKRVKEGGRAAEEHCEGVLSGLIDSLQKHYSTVRELILAHETAAVAQAESSLCSMEKDMAALKRRDAELGQLSQTDDDIHFLQRLPSLSNLPEPPDLSSVSTDPHLPFEAIRSAVSEFGNRLEAFAEEEISTVSQTVAGNGGSQSPNHRVIPEQLPVISAAQTPEPTTRTEFLQYACELTLDPNTAHKDLSLSEDGRMVRWDAKKQKEPVQPHSERFNYRRQVLCKKGLEAERCYWEVEVVGNKAEIALAYWGIDRKSVSKRSAFGASDQSWSLDRSKGYSVCHNSEGVALCATPSQCRLGVYLQFKEGTITFYEVSDKMELLYRTKKFTFTEPLYPGFWLGEESCITLCNLRHERF
ncbi:tripartite motif-containing protein 16-like protein [Oncorhynchus keta]|uniref:tripartite motif-containing protein 16-like protein n=1 Tax=Oncorhynchus keta TaxID=8018 RepID=UPI0015FCA8FD|nr:tripartite motif-containing protein 16-like protein [Oncorhynchus keta]